MEERNKGRRLKIVSKKESTALLILCAVTIILSLAFFFTENKVLGEAVAFLLLFILGYSGFKFYVYALREGRSEEKTNQKQKISISERDQNSIGNCAEKNANTSGCTGQLGMLCDHCSAQKDGQLED